MLPDDPTLDLETSIARSLRAPRVSLLVYSRDGVKVLPLTPGRPVVVGRGVAADVPLRDAGLSRRHAAFELRAAGPDGARLAVTDLASTNGVHVNGTRITPSEAVAFGAADRVTLGSVVAALHEAAPLSAEPSGLSSHEQLLSLLEHEVARARTFRRSVTLALLRHERGADEPPHGWFPAFAEHLRPVDRAALYDHGTVELLLPEADDALLEQLLGEAAEPRSATSTAGAVLVGAASCPSSATGAEALLCGAREALARATPRAPLRRAPHRGVAHADLGAHPSVGDGSAAPIDDPAELDGDAMVLAAPALAALDALVGRLAATDLSVLVIGETGSGKELVARALHRRGARARGPFVAINCAAIPAQLVVSTLFGHERGAFTGASQRARGVFEQAHRGTLFLDEVGELSPQAQSALLRVLETGRLTRVGGNTEVAVDVRVVAATHRDLEQLADAGAFRWDLLYRLDAVRLPVPPLRRCPEAIPALVQRFLGAARIDPEALEQLRRYQWPGNVRQLRNVIERAAVLARGEVVTVDDLPDRVQTLGVSQAATTAAALAPQNVPHDGASGASDDDAQTFRQRVRRFEAAQLLSALTRCGFNQAKAARDLGISARAMYHKCRVHSLAKDARDTARRQRELASLGAQSYATAEGEPLPLRQQIECYEAELLERALLSTGFNKTAAARALRMPLRTLVHKVGVYQIRES